MSLSEQSIAKKASEGDGESFGILYDIYIKKIYRFVYFKTHHKETAEDLTSKIFIKAYQGIKRLDLRKGNFPGWIYKIARNTVIDYYRTQKYYSDIDDIWDLYSSEKLEEDTDTVFMIGKVKECLVQLSSLQRDIIIMRLWDGMSYKEISQALEKSEARWLFQEVSQRLKL